MKATKFQLTIDEFDNDAFVANEASEVARLLREVANRVEDNGVDAVDTATLYDLNGNNVGQVIVESEADAIGGP